MRVLRNDLPEKQVSKLLEVGQEACGGDENRFCLPVQQWLCLASMFKGVNQGISHWSCVLRGDSLEQARVCLADMCLADRNEGSVARTALSALPEQRDASMA
jgi:hypothetical protein